MLCIILPENIYGESKPKGAAASMAMDPSQMPQGAAGLQALKFNMVAMSKLFSRYGQADLAVGEATCTDRCTLKFIAAAQMVAKQNLEIMLAALKTTKSVFWVTEEMQKAQEMEMQQMQARQQMGNAFGGQ
eukprot:jgi/Bigna1/130233/aug1.10_g4941